MAAKKNRKRNPAPKNDELVDLLDRWQRHRIVVAGDYMLDRYLYGNAQRLSPDAPVPVLAARRNEQKPGGAANVCLDLLALGCRVSCLGLIGADDTGRQLREALRRAGCNTSGLIATRQRTTTVKHNFVGMAQHRHPQKMFRVDEETCEPLSARDSARLIAAARRLLRGASVLCIEDYNKGVVTESICQALIRLAAAVDATVLVDPAAISDYRKYRGADCITPNRTEAAAATGVDFAETGNPKVLEAMAAKLLKSLAARAVVVTLDRQGLLLAQRRRPATVVPTKARSVYDVAGAGDMVLAMMAAAHANGADWRAAVEMANVAAGLEVEKFGVEPVALDEVLLSVLREHHGPQGKVRQVQALRRELTAYRNQGRRIVFTNGCFDILHAGHVAFLREARACGDILVVGLNSDRSIRRLKGGDRPVNRVEDRVMILSELQSVDYIVVFDQDTPIKLIRAVRPDILVKGAGYRRRDVVGGDYVESYGGRVHLVKPVKGRSTTNIIRKISKTRSPRKATAS